MNGGYLMVSKADTKIYDKLQLGLKVGKPILWYESETVCYYIDTISGGEITTEIVDDEEVITYGDIILNKGGKTITVSYDGTDAAVTEEGEIISNRLENIVDKNGNLRFIEGELDTKVIEGVTFTYNKWSLSGTHLMIVLSGTVADTTVIPVNTIWAEIKGLPNYIFSKIVPIFLNRISTKTINFYANSFTYQSSDLALEKRVNSLEILSPSITATADRSFRIQFDLLIDADYSE